MRPLDQINSSAVHPRRFTPICALLPLLAGGCALALAGLAAPALPLTHNLAAWPALAALAAALFMLIAPRLMRWGWEAAWFAMPALAFGSCALFSVVPAIGLLLFGTLPLAARAAIFAAYLACHVLWCRRFVRFYARVWHDDGLRRKLYQEEADAIYYCQRGDQFLLEKKPTLAQMPGWPWWLASFLAAGALFPFGTFLQHATGVPGLNLFVLSIGFPVGLLCVGFATRACLVWIVYPGKLRRLTGKTTYIDMAAKISPPANAPGAANDV